MSDTPTIENDYKDNTFDMFRHSAQRELFEIKSFNQWRDSATENKNYVFETVHQAAQYPEISIKRDTGEQLNVINFGCYNYLGYSYHPEVIAATKEALDTYGLGSAAAPITSGTLEIHSELEKKALEFFGLDDKKLTLFSSGFAANLGTIQAFLGPGCHIILDQYAHMSLIEGARMSQASISFFRHNQMASLEKHLKKSARSKARTLVCTEGIFSADGNYGKLNEIVSLAKQYGAYTLVDEAHSALVAGESGRGVCEMQNVLSDVDFYIMTFSKAFGGIGGAVLTKESIGKYINWYATCRMFSCAMSPPMAGGLTKVFELVQNSDGANRRKRLHENAAYMREKLRDKVDIGSSESWIIPVIYGKENKTLDINNFIQQNGLEAGIMQFPAVSKNQARLRLFVTSEHTRKHLDRAADIILEAARQFNFNLG